ncbi:hypothetical protein DDP54_02820 [Cellulomonas sp. WB94]|uniref:hypothetical protein n=1 Tax=Cellulomonas sp. WB94 TaxID=2173174 RepID=UPI000D57D2D3|nr:hypothetical protein [Cellulomonas sp. WB94]PVU82116.1 hypothetical protein DDP54_02820 [Cellulomonas sp. WB94]
MRAKSVKLSRGVTSGVLWVGAGIGVYGLSSFAFLAIAGHALGQSPGYNSLALLWTLLNALGIGLYLPIEQESGRTIAARRSLSHTTSGTLAGPTRYAAVTLITLAAVAFFARRPIADGMFSGNTQFTAVFVVALAGMAIAYLVRGILAGTGRFPRYGLQLAIDGLFRVAGASALAAAGSPDAVSYGIVLAGAPMLASALALARSGRLLDPGSTGRTGATGGIVRLAVASLASQSLANAGPVAVQLLKRSNESASAGNLVNALTVARIPLFLFAAVQAVFLPTLARYVGLGSRDKYEAALSRATSVTALLGALGVLATWGAGPEAVRLLFGPTFDIGRLDIVLLAASAALFMNVQVLVQGLLARSADAPATASWVVGLIGFGAGLTLPLPLSTRVSAALVCGSLAALAAASIALRRALSHWAQEVGHGPDAA